MTCFSFSVELELPRLASDTRPFLRLLLADGVPGVAGVLPPEEGVLLVAGVPGDRDLPGVPGVLTVPCTGAWLREDLWVGVRCAGRPLCSISWQLGPIFSGCVNFKFKTSLNFCFYSKWILQTVTEAFL